MCILHSDTGQVDAAGEAATNPFVSGRTGQRLRREAIFCRTMLAARSPIMIVTVLVLSDTTVGMTDESAARKP